MHRINWDEDVIVIEDDKDNLPWERWEMEDNRDKNAFRKAFWKDYIYKVRA